MLALGFGYHHRCMAMLVAVLGAVSAAGCARPSQGTRPHEMNVAGHGAAADRQEAEESKHAAQYDPNAQTTVPWRTGTHLSRDIPSSCYTPYAGTSTTDNPPLCFTTIINPTEAHRREAERHRKLA